MKSTFSTFLQSVLFDIALDRRVTNGTVNLNEDLHRMILAEKLIDRNIDPNLVQEVVNKLAIRDGKYPDRQAYNKEGWLVTFPSPEHREAALKNKTHFTSDPTHGQGGMNLYYKRKGKQARQKNQDSSETETGEESPAQPSQDGNESNLPPAGADSAPEPSGEPPSGAEGAEQSSLPSAGGSAPDEQSTEEPTSDDNDSASAEPEKPATTVDPASGVTVVAGSAPTEQPEQAPSGLVPITVDFAKSKGWVTTPYGDWNDKLGKVSAVTGLDGQVVPIKFTDREELKTFAAKRGHEQQNT